VSESLESAVERFLEHKRRSAASITARSTNCAARLLRRRARARRLDQPPSPCLRTSSGPSRGSRRAASIISWVVAGLLDWAVTHELLEASPLQVRPPPGDLDTRLVPFRRLPGAPAARCRGRAAGQLPRPATRAGLSRRLRPVLRARTTRRRGVRPAPSRHRHRPLPGRRARRQVRQEPPRPGRARIAGLVEEQAGRRRACGTAAGPDSAPAGRAQRVCVSPG
jgi:hypothetical protein